MSSFQSELHSRLYHHAGNATTHFLTDYSVVVVVQYIVFRQSATRQKIGIKINWSPAGATRMEVFS